VRRQTYGYLSSRRASLPFDQYQIILLGEQRHMCANNMPIVVTWQCNGQELNQQLHGHMSDILPLHHQATHNGDYSAKKDVFISLYIIQLTAVSKKFILLLVV